MACSWRRTLASVFLLLSSHSVRVFSQNVVPNGPLSSHPFMTEQINDGIGFGPGPFQQQINYMQPSQEFVPLIPCTPQGFSPDQFRFGPPFPLSQFSPGLQNIGPIQPGPPVRNIDSIANGPQLHDPASNLPPNINASPLQVPKLPLNFPPPLITLPPPTLNIPNTQPQGQLQNFIPVSLLSQAQNYNAHPAVNLPPPPCLSSNDSPVPLKPGLQYPIYTGPQVSSSPLIPGQNFIAPLNPNVLQNSDFLNYPPYAQSCPPSTFNPDANPMLMDLPPMTYLQPPNLPPIQKYIPIPPTPFPFQPIIGPPTYPMEYFPMVPGPPESVPFQNYQVGALPPVLPVLEAPQCFKYDTCQSPQPPEEQYPLPINLEINVPPPTIPEPKITVITAFSSPPPSPSPADAINNSDVSFGFLPPPLPPIIIETRRSSSRSWLPLILIALFARDGCDGCRGCCCPCYSENADIPIPYPIPIPTSNPIIVGKSGRSRHKGSKGKGAKEKTL